MKHMSLIAAIAFAMSLAACSKSEEAAPAPTAEVAAPVEAAPATPEVAAPVEAAPAADASTPAPAEPAK